MCKLGFIFSLILLLSLPVQAQEVSTLFISNDDMVAALKQEFVEQGVEEQLDIEFFGGQLTYAIENARVYKIMITGLKYDSDQNKFTAGAEIFADGNPYAKTTLSGKYYVMGEAWVPARNIEKDEVINIGSLKKIPVRINRIKGTNVVEKDKLLGMQAKKSLKEGRIITERDIGEVILIKKGKVVTSVYKAKGLQITAKAEALEDGARGQNIEVMNIKSSKKFHATVTDAETVEINTEE